MGGKDHWLIAVFCGNFVQFFDKNRAARLQALDHIAVMYDFMANIDRRTIFLQRQHDDLDCPVNPGAKAAGAAKADFQWWSLIGHEVCSLVRRGLTSKVC